PLLPGRVRAVPGHDVRPRGRPGRGGPGVHPPRRRHRAHLLAAVGHTGQPGAAQRVDRGLDLRNRRTDQQPRCARPPRKDTFMSRLPPTAPRTGTGRETDIVATTAEEVAATTARAATAAGDLAARPRSWRAGLLRALADALEADRAELVTTAISETGLAEARLNGELTRSAFQLRACADALEADRAELVTTAISETGLAEARANGELTRSAFQLPLFADAVDEGSYLEAIIDHAGDTPLGPGPDVRRMLVPIGPVAVFGA